MAKIKFKPHKNIKPGGTLIVYIILRSLVILTLVMQCIHGNYTNVFTCILTLLLFYIPDIAERTLNIDLPNVLEVIIYLFIFSAEILGEINNFYMTIPHWDTVLHTINGFLMAAIGFSMIDVLNRHPYFHITLSPVFVAVVAFCFSMTIGVVWEFFEYNMDITFRTDMQKDFVVQSISSVSLHPEKKNIPIVLKDIQRTDIHYIKNGKPAVETIQNGYLDIGLKDTIKDLKVNFIGAVAFSVIGYIYIINRGKGFAGNLIPKLKKSNKNIDAP